MSFSVTILGSGSATPTTKRNPTAQLIRIFNRTFLIDCGEGTQMQLQKYKLKFLQIDHILISHLHGDHFFGLIGLLSSMHLLGREKKIHIYANESLQQIINLQLSSSQTQLKYDIVWNNLEYNTANVIYEDKAIEVLSFPLSHRIPTCGFIIREKQKLLSLIKEQIIKYDIPIEQIDAIKFGADLVLSNKKIIANKEITKPLAQAKSYAYCSDTIYDESIIPYIKKVTLLYHESTFAHDLLARAQATFHTTTIQAASIAKQAEVGTLLMGHFSARYTQVDSLLEEAKTVFNNCIAVEDGLTFNV